VFDFSKGFKLASTYPPRAEPMRVVKPSPLGTESGRPTVFTAGDEGGRAVASTAMVCDCRRFLLESSLVCVAELGPGLELCPFSGRSCLLNPL